MSRVEIYRDAKRRYRWRLVKYGHIMADSGQGYSRRIDCLNGCATVLGGELGETQGQTLIMRLKWDGYYHRDEDIEVRDLTKAPR